MESWEKQSKHNSEVREELMRQGCMDARRRLRSWKRDTWDKLRAIGHTSLDAARCDCCR